ncbi:hypothetical protein OROMI_019260 [Orobanche minor]
MTSTSYKQRKRKRVDITRKQDECMDVSVKPPNGAGRGYQQATECIRMPHLEPQIKLRILPGKVKLQLFPINEETRMGLEKDGHNPFLELTLSARKRISSVVRHLNTKWGSSSVVIGQLMLFPYNTMLEEVASCKRWTLNDSAITAWEVYVDVGSPSIFRLRYGWYSNFQHGMFDMPPKTSLLEARRDSEDHKEEKTDEYYLQIKDQNIVGEPLHSDVNDRKTLDSPTGFPDNEATDVPTHTSVPWDDSLTNLSIGGLLSAISTNRSDLDSANRFSMQPIGLMSDISIGHLLSEASLLGKISNPSTKLENESSSQRIFLSSSDISIGGLLSEASLLSDKNKLDAQIQSLWYDDLTTLSIGGLFSDASLQGKSGGGVLKEGKLSLELDTPVPGSSDSLVSTQIKQYLQMPKPSQGTNHLSILDGEETCHAFPVRKLQTDGDASIKMNNETVFPKDFSCQEIKTSPLPPHFSTTFTAA